MKTVIRILAVIAIISIGVRSQAQEQPKHEGQEHAPAAVTVPEVEKFHQLLHPLVHDAYPNNDFAAIKKALPKLAKTATSMSKAGLPKELASARGDFKKATKKLVQQLRDLDRRKKRLGDKEFGEEFMAMHDTFEGIMGLIR